MKTLLADSLNTFPIKDNSVFNNGPKSLPKNSTTFAILCNWVFNNFILVEELFEKT